MSDEDSLLPPSDVRYQMRPCGPCTACCTVMAVKSLEKEAGERCKQCSIGENGETPGCRIYERRPLECKSFVCLWAHGLKFLRDDDRPDNIKVFLHSFEDRHGDPCVSFSELERDALNRPRVQELVAEVLAGGFTIRYRHFDGHVNWIDGQGGYKRFVPKAATDLPDIADDGRIIVVKG